MKYLLISFAAFAILFSSCETEVDLTGEYEDITVVFGLIDLSAEKQVFRINKTFLGEGDAFDMALVADSSEYNIADVEAWLEFGNNQIVTLNPEYIPQRQPGAFYDTNVLVYTTTENLAVTNDGTPVDLEGNQLSTLVNEFRLKVQVKDRLLQSTTVPVVIRENNITEPVGEGGSSANTDLKWVNPTGTIYFDRSFKHTTVASGARYERKIVFRYREHYVNGDPVDKSIEYPLGATNVPANSSIQQISAPYGGQDVLAFLGNTLTCDGNISYRTVISVDFVLAVAGEDLATYMSVNAPLTGVVTERPSFTNMEGGLGLFSSRFTVQRTKNLHTDTKIALYIGEFTGDLCFCDPSPGSSYPCPVGVACSCE
jgi:hypothetical protein